MNIKSIAVFCGSSTGNQSVYIEETKKLGVFLAQNNIRLIYGGAKVGLMKALAESMMKHGGKITGVMPKSIHEFDISDYRIDDLQIVESMSERKEKLIAQADAFIALPGGMGTLDELFEVLVLSQLRIENKACGILNINGYYDKLIDFLSFAVAENFVRQEHLNNIFTEQKSDILIHKMQQVNPVSTKNWIRDIKNESRKKL